MRIYGSWICPCTTYHPHTHIIYIYILKNDNWIDTISTESYEFPIWASIFLPFCDSLIFLERFPSQFLTLTVTFSRFIFRWCRTEAAFNIFPFRWSILLIFLAVVIIIYFCKYDNRMQQDELLYENSIPIPGIIRKEITREILSAIASSICTLKFWQQNLRARN